MLSVKFQNCKHAQGDDMMMDDVEEFVSNPINTYTMIKRLTLYWPSVRDHLFNQTLIGKRIFYFKIPPLDGAQLELKILCFLAHVR